MSMVPTIEDKHLVIRIPVDAETLRVAPLSSSGENRMLSGAGAALTITTPDGVPVQLRCLAYFPADQIFPKVMGPEKVLEALEHQVEAFSALGKKADATKLAKAQAKLDAFAAKLKAARK